MNDKSLVKLGDVAHECRQTWNGDQNNVPIVGLEHLIPGEIELYSWDSNIEHTFSKKFVKGQVLLGRRRVYLKKAAVAPCDGICSGDITVIESTGGILPELLPFVIQNDRFFDYAMQGSAGSLSPRVKWEHLKNYEFPLPPLTEQKVLADKLWAAYRLKESYKKLLAATEEMVKSQFIEMFGNPDDGWKYPTKRLGEVYDIGTGGTPDRKVSGYYEGNIPWVKSTEVNYCELYDTEEHISEQAIKDSNCSLYPPGTILLAMYGQGTTRGRVAQLRTDATVNQAIAAIQVQDETESLFLYSMMKVCYDYVRNHAVGGNQHNLNLKLVSSIPLVVPPKELQQQFVSIAEQTDKSGSVLQYRIAC